jgi:hypothetical protein
MDVAVSLFGRDTMRRYENVTWDDGNIHVEGIIPHLNEGTFPTLHIPKKINVVVMLGCRLHI